MHKKLIFLILLGLAGLQSSAQLLSLEKPDNLIHISTKLENGSRDFGFSIFSEFMCATETWNTSCGLDNGKVIVYIDGGVLLYHIMIWRNSDNQKLLDVWTTNSKVELLNLKPGGYKVIVDDSNTPVPNNYTLFNAVVGASSAPVISIDAKYNENCGGGDGWIQAKAKEGVGPYMFKLLNTGEQNSTGKFNNLHAGTYNVQVSDANFCTDVESVLILNIGASVYSAVMQKTTCDSIWSLKLDTVKSGKSFITGCDSFTIIKYNFKPKFTFWLYDLSCNPLDTGDFFVGKFANIYGCDSLVWKRVGYAPKGIYTFETIKTYCAGTEGTDTIPGRSQNGCDSNHVITRILEGVRIVYMPTLNSCFQRPDSVYTHKSVEGCDSSLSVTHFNVLPKDTTRLTKAFCMPRIPDTVFLINRFLCDSVVITNYLLKKLDTTFVNLKTCDPALAGKKVFNLITRDSFCDSVVVETTILTKKLDTARLTFYVCGLKKPVHKEIRLQNSFGCLDSLVIIDSLVASSITMQLPLTRTCDKSLAGNFIDTLATRYGCDSIIKWSVAYVPPYRKVNLSYVCDKSQAGVFPHYFTNQYGCDSTVIDSAVYAGSTPTVLADSVICGSKNSETMSEVKLQNRFGCDSIVKRKLITFESPVLKIDGYTHPTSKWNGSIDLSVSKGTAPWTLYDGQGNEVPWKQYDKKGGLYPFVVVDANGCWDSIAVALSDFWAYTQGRTIHVHGGLADDELVNEYYRGEEAMIEVYSGQNLLETRRIQNIRLEFDLTFPSLKTAGVYYFRMVFPNRPGHYLVTKGVIQ